MNMVKVCFIGHRDIEITDELLFNLEKNIEYLIINKNAIKFLFGSHSDFNDICFDIVSKLKEKYPFIKRVMVRHDVDYLNERVKQSYLENYEEIVLSEKIVNAKKYSYVARNKYMIDESDFCVFYYKKDYIALTDKKSVRNSGTFTAFKYAMKNKKCIINLTDKNTFLF